MTDADTRRLVTWALATFHTTLFTLAVVLLVYSKGGLGLALASLNTIVGLGLFIVLWASTLFTTRRALAGSDPLAADLDRARFERRALRMGAANGIVFLVVLGAGLVIGSMAATQRGNPLSVLGVAAIAAPFAVAGASVIGAVVGMTLGAVDLALFGLARKAIAR